MTDIKIVKISEVWCQVYCSNLGIKHEISQYFSFQVPNFQYHPSVKAKMWDGIIRLYKFDTSTLYCGLVSELIKFANDNAYDIEIDPSLDINNKLTIDDIKLFCEWLKLDKVNRNPYDYQLTGILECLNKNRACIVSPTGSGKSLMIYVIIRYLIECFTCKRVLLVVPTINLVDQMKSDFISYGCNEKPIHTIFGGEEKDTNKPIVISTWQSIYKLPKSYFEQFDGVIIDEVHQAKSSSLVGILEKLIDCKYRYGFTGTLQDAEAHRFTIEGLIGQGITIAKTNDLIDQKILSPLKIKTVILNYNQVDRKKCNTRDYHKELEFLFNNSSRNKFIISLVKNCKGNTIILFDYVQKHGKPMFELLKEHTGKKCYFIYGATESIDRETIRTNIERETDSIILASSRIYSTGVNIKNIHNIVFIHSTKSSIKTIQSIGRGLRIHESKHHLNIFDVVDNLSLDGRNNFCLNHFIEDRRPLYLKNEFPVEMFNIKLS